MITYQVCEWNRERAERVLVVHEYMSEINAKADAHRLRRRQDYDNRDPEYCRYFVRKITTSVQEVG